MVAMTESGLEIVAMTIYLLVSITRKVTEGEMKACPVVGQMTTVLIWYVQTSVTCQHEPEAWHTLHSPQSSLSRSPSHPKSGIQATHSLPRILLLPCSEVARPAGSLTPSKVINRALESFHASRVTQYPAAYE